MQKFDPTLNLLSLPTALLSLLVRKIKRRAFELFILPKCYNKLVETRFKEIEIVLQTIC